MKPKNRIMCPDCGRMKMQFDSYDAAERFIKFNGSEVIKPGTKLRIYYCPACCCYHISSKKYTRKYEHNTDKLIKAYKADLKLRGKVKDARDKAKELEVRRRNITDAIYWAYLNDTQIHKINEFIRVHYLDLIGDNDKELGRFASRIKNRLDFEREDKYKLISKIERRKEVNDIYQAFRTKFNNYNEACFYIRTHYKMLPTSMMDSLLSKFQKFYTEKEITI